jgi:transposase
MKQVAFLGVDYHIKTITIAVYLDKEKKFYETIRLNNDDKTTKKYMKKLSTQFDLKICYEASCSGYVFQRKMQALGYHCDVIAPSLTPKKPGDRRKNDIRDAKKLAQNYANGLLTIVHPPTQEEESVRSLIRCRIAMKGSAKKAKQQINSFLLSQGCRWSKSKWTKQHHLWLSKLEMPNIYLQQVLDEYLGHLSYLESRLQYLEQQIKQIANSELYAPSVKKLRALRGIETLTAMVLIAEITDFRRFPNPRSLMAFLGLIPGEDSSDDTRKDVSITKAGNIRCRNILTESAQHYVKKPRISVKMKQLFSQVDAHSAVTAKKCMYRLHKRYWSLVMKGKARQKAIVAIARELVGFIWAIMQPVSCAAA